MTEITAGEVIAWLTAGLSLPPATVDGLLAGEEGMAVSGVVTAFSASVPVIRQAVRLQANLLITHEGMYYSHRDDPQLRDNPVAADKARLVAEAGLAVYRCHDGIHRRTPDSVTEGLVRALGWDRYPVRHLSEAAIVELPGLTAAEATAEVKEKLGLGYVRVAGNFSVPCRRAGLLVGYRGGGRNVIPLIRKEGLDLVIAGEGPEWETPEFVKDANELGGASALLMLGHAESEEPGMELLAEQLRRQFSGMPVFFVRDRPAFRVL